MQFDSYNIEKNLSDDLAYYYALWTYPHNHLYIRNNYR
jgi:hypothetical protein